jgi:hypothetical protein
LKRQLLHPNQLDCPSTQIAELTALAGRPLTFLHFNHNPASDLSPLKGMPLAKLEIYGTGIPLRSEAQPR